MGIKHSFGKISAASFILLVCLFGAYPRPAHALVVIDPVNLVKNTITAVQTQSLITKETILDPIAWNLSTAALQSVTKSMVTWINSGFNGSPAFVTDLDQHLLDVGDAQANSFFNQLSSSGSINSPFRDTITQSLRNNYYQSTGKTGFTDVNAFTLGQASPNPSAFLGGDFTQGGFSALFSSFASPQNNPLGFSLLAQQGSAASIGNAEGDRVTELNWGNGFASFRGNCTSSTGPVSLSSRSGSCVGNPILTPGSTIKDALSHQLGAGADKLVSSDELSEVMNALFGQLINKTLSGGLAALTKPSSGGGGSALSQATSNSGNTTSGTDIQTNFLQTIQGQRTQVVQYQTDWAKIATAAANAKTACASKADVISGQIQPVLDQATSAAARAATALSALDNLATQANALTTSTDQNTSLNGLSAAYSALTSGTPPILPTATEIAAADINASEEGTDAAGTPSLYAQMAQVSDTCTLFP